MTSIHSLGIEGTIQSPSSGPEYTDALYRNSDLSILEAKYVVFPASYADISRVLSHATSQSPPLEIAIKCGGAHSSTWASSQGGIVIDLGKLKQVVVSKDKRRVTVQGGAVWGDVYEECGNVGVEAVGAHIWFVGVAGFLLGGGHSHLSGQYGLGIDNLLSAKVVLADGRIVMASPTEEPDLFWAIRGGGGHFGVVVEFVLKAFPPTGPFTVGSLVYPGTEFPNVLKMIQEFLKTYSIKERVAFSFVRAPPHFKPTVLVIPWVTGGTARSDTLLAPFRKGPPSPVADTCVDAPDLLAVSHSADAALSRAPRRLTIRGSMFSEFWTDMVLEIWERWCEFTENNPDAKGTMVHWDTGHKEMISSVGKTETAFQMRDPHYSVAFQGRNVTPASDAASSAFVASMASYVQRVQREKTHTVLGIILNFAQGNERPEDIYGVNLPRLRKLKAKYDPTKVFNKGVVIEPDFGL